MKDEPPKTSTKVFSVFGSIFKILDKYYFRRRFRKIILVYINLKDYM